MMNQHVGANSCTSHEGASERNLWIDRDDARRSSGLARPARVRKQPHRRSAGTSLDAIERSLKFATERQLTATRDVQKLSVVVKEKIKAVGAEVFVKQRPCRTSLLADEIERAANSLRWDAMSARDRSEDMQFTQMRKGKQAVCTVDCFNYRAEHPCRSAVAATLTKAPRLDGRITELQEVCGLPGTITRRLIDRGTAAFLQRR
jgi:hypothetical protein